MKIKVFNIRLADEHLEHDQNKVNNFLAGVEMKKSSSTLVTSKNHFWSIIIHYEDKSQKADETQEKEFSPITPVSATQSKPKKRKGTVPEDNQKAVLEDHHKSGQKPKPAKISLDDLTKQEIYMLDNLKSWRADKAQKDKVPPFVILWDQHLIEVIKAKPKTPEELIEVKGFSSNRVNKYGEDILSILGAF